ncbi:conjugal transfer protein MobC [Cytophagaceae bacterium DM2B3-1]|uniref:Conjugal transfer protein MobC n=1 Tax=Xanthocytophaga flava TaxID=3048013 RepID=A0ABT7CV48_9BACT|nr:conjugal transfer protein MobC [Xanthocytophaga flavus]MDJ1497590.1 conjugal transfer protein MobC [Xanthocytophaga flavus]
MEDQKAFLKIAHLTRAASIIVLLINFYIFCYAFFIQLGWVHPTVASTLSKFESTSIFSASYLTKILSLILLGLSCIGNTGNQTEDITWKKTWPYLVSSLIIFFGSNIFLYLSLPTALIACIYMFLSAIGFILFLKGGTYAMRIMSESLNNDIFNKENESFPQEQRYLQNDYSVNIETRYYYKGKTWKGWINVVNPFRGAMVLGTPGSGKSFVFVNSYIQQLMKKGFSMYIYDFKFDDLTKIAYNALIEHSDKFKVKPEFYVINFDNPRKSHRCNPLYPTLMKDITDAYESASTIMFNLNRSWIKKQGDFFVESPINFLAALIWFLKLYENGRFCTLPHVIELLSMDYEELFPILGSYNEIEVLVKPFVSAFDKGAADQLEGQIASARIGLGRLASKQLYYVMSGNDFTLDINNPESPKILCVGNNPKKQGIYGAALGLYNARLVKLVNEKHKLPSALIIDELPTIYFKGLDNLIATARSNKVATLLGFQDFSQLERDYGKDEATVIENIVGNVFVGQVVGDTAKKLSERFGKINQRKKSITTSQSGTSVSISTNYDYRIPQDTMAELSQGTFVGSVADDRGQEMELKVFHSQMHIDTKEVEKKTKAYEDVPEFNAKNFINPVTGEDILEKVIDQNYIQIKMDVDQIIENEFNRLGLKRKGNEDELSEAS